jgi:hypothetical protein
MDTIRQDVQLIATHYNARFGFSISDGLASEMFLVVGVADLWQHRPVKHGNGHIKGCQSSRRQHGRRIHILDVFE